MTGLRDYGGRDWARLENSNSDPVMNDIIGFTPCNFCDYMCMNFKFVAHLPPWYNLLQNDASLADTFFMIDGALTFEGCDSSVLSGAGRRVRIRREPGTPRHCQRGRARRPPVIRARGLGQ